MLSICIPIYNYDVTALVYELNKQAEASLANYEILLIDDNSSIISLKEKNRELNKLNNVRYIELDKNIRRSAIRNLLANESKCSYLLFMDCDAAVCKDDYIIKYLAECKPNVVCCGGCAYNQTPPPSDHLLRWHIGIHRESSDATSRNKQPNSKFTAFNFLIDKHILLNTPFDEKLNKYGHEDTLFGIELMNKNVRFTHIDNPLIHLGIDTTEIFLKKTEEGIINLIEIEENMEDKTQFIQSVKLLNTYYKLKKLYLTHIYILGFRIFRKTLLNNLKGENPKLTYFDAYKLGCVCLLKAKKGP